MKSDIDSLLAERNLDGLLVMGDRRGTVMRYLMGDASLEGVLLLKQKGQPLTLVHRSMDRDTASTTGFKLINRDEHFDRYTLLQKHKGDLTAAQADFVVQSMRAAGLHGRIGIYGMEEIGDTLAVVERVARMADNVELVGEQGKTLFTAARETKDEAELADLRRAGDLTCKVMGEVQEFIQHHHVWVETVLRSDGEPLAIGDVKAFIRERLPKYGLREERNIFAQGRDAGVAHNRRTLDMPLQLGRSIIFDFFPMVQSGYYHDITRTWSLGYATDAVQEAWEQCKTIFDRVMANLAVGRPAREYQSMTCDSSRRMDIRPCAATPTHTKATSTPSVTESASTFMKTRAFSTSRLIRQF